VPARCWANCRSASTPSRPPPAAADAPAEAAEDSTAADATADAPAAAPSTFGAFRFTAEYRQVFSYTTPAPQPLALAA
jgi:hypothetical protein